MKTNKKVIAVAAWRSIPWMVKKIKLLKKRLIKRRSRVCPWLPNGHSSGWGNEYRDAMDEVREELNKLIKEIEAI